MGKIYFLWNLNQPFLAVEFRQRQLQFAVFSDSCYVFETFLLRLFVKKSQQFLQWHVSASIFFQGSLKEKQSPESLYGKIAGFFLVICQPDRSDVTKTQGHWKKLKPVQFIEMINWLVVFKPVQRDTRCVDYVSSGFRCKFFVFPQIQEWTYMRIFYWR